jgi:hypothetical protein
VKTVVNRRDLLAGAAVIAGSVVLPRMDFKVEPAPLSALLIDRRYAESRSFGEALQKSAVRVIDVSEDICRHWYGGNMISAGAAIAGLTTWIDFVVMQGCAREAGMSVMFESRHVCVSMEVISHTFTHDLSGCAALASASWPESVASWIRVGSWQSAASPLRQTVLGRNAYPRLMQWVSWVIAKSAHGASLG